MEALQVVIKLAYLVAAAFFITGTVGAAILIFLTVLALPNLITGWGLLKFRPWARILALILETASGRKSKSEELGYGEDEFAPWTLGATM